MQNYGVFMEALRRSAPVPITFEKLAENMDGYFSVDKQRIAVREGMSEVQTVCAAVHEIAHSKLHNKDEIGEKYQAVELFGKPALFSNGRIDRDKLPEGLYVYDLRGSDYDPGMPVTLESHVTVNHAASVITAAPIELPEQGFLYLGEDGLNFTGGEQTVKEFLHAQYPEKAKLSRAAEEIQAESISFAVCAYYGIETGENSFGYLAAWAKDRELTELRASLETINRTSSSLITDIDRHYAEICKERGLDKETESLAAQPMQEIAVQEQEPVTAPDNGCVPDPAISVESMNAYGYTDSNMLPLTKERALELMEQDVSVYMLHTDNTEAMAFDAEEVRSFDGIFGVEASEWEMVKDRFAPPDYEKAFLSNPADSFAIYQLRDNDNTAQLRFMNAEYLEKKGLSAQKENYAAVYAGSLDRRGDTQDRLDALMKPSISAARRIFAATAVRQRHRGAEAERRGILSLRGFPGLQGAARLPKAGKLSQKRGDDHGGRLRHDRRRYQQRAEADRGGAGGTGKVRQAHLPHGADTGGAQGTGAGVTAGEEALRAGKALSSRQ